MIQLFLFFQLSVLEVELGAVKEERDQYKSDIDDSELSKDQLIKKAWEVRDAAVKRKNTAEIDLAKERIATMQINSQVRQTQNSPIYDECKTHPAKDFAMP